MDSRIDLTPAAMTGLAWYYLLASAINALAAAHLAYGDMIGEGASREGMLPKTRRFPAWLRGACLALFASACVLGLVALAGPIASRSSAGLVAYVVAGLANCLLAIVAGADAAHFAEVHDEGHGVGQEIGPPSLDDHVPAVGLGRPINRTLWALVWAVVAVVFQAMGLVSALHHEFGMPDFAKDFADLLTSPATFTLKLLAAVALGWTFRRTLASGLVAWGLLDLALLVIGLSLSDADFRTKVIEPDHLPAVGLVVLLAGATWFALRRGVINEARRELDLPPLVDPTARPGRLALTILGLTTGLALWSLLVPAPLGPPSAPDSRSIVTPAAWYLAAFREAGHYLDPRLANVGLPVLVLVALLTIPFLKTGQVEAGTTRRPSLVALVLAGLFLLWLALTLFGTFFRGPDGSVVGPFSAPTIGRTAHLPGVDLSTAFWIEWLGASRPADPIRRELPGLLAVVATVVAVLLLGRFATRRLGGARSIVASLLLLALAGLAIKMALQWTIGLRYLVALPEYGLNL